MEKEKIGSLEKLISLDQNSKDEYACYRCFTMQPLDDFPQGAEYEDKCKAGSQYAKLETDLPKLLAGSNMEVTFLLNSRDSTPISSDAANSAADNTDNKGRLVMLKDTQNSSNEVDNGNGTHEWHFAWRCPFVQPCTKIKKEIQMIRNVFGDKKHKNKMDFLPSHIWPGLCNKHYRELRVEQKDWVPFMVTVVREFLLRVKKWNEERENGPLFEYWSIRQPGCRDVKLRVAWILDDESKQYTTTEILNITLRLEDEAQKNRYPKFPAVQFLPVITN